MHLAYTACIRQPLSELEHARLQLQPVLAMEREAHFLSLETFGRVGQHVPKQSRTAYSCAWPTYLRIYL